ncbi:hypothetical protein [Eisenbergiella porci]|uniref:hypothetical protein n=1 Tax=Eisenbergiella porci TaxID=2652274 RepID=UPI002A83FBB3|nr:hypothetical protein [Eisenbergiella porci]
MENEMTENQLTTILRMFSMILDGCQDLEEAKGKVDKLLVGQQNNPGDWTTAG